MRQILIDWLIDGDQMSTTVSDFVKVSDNLIDCDISDEALHMAVQLIDQCIQVS